MTIGTIPWFLWPPSVGKRRNSVVYFLEDSKIGFIHGEKGRCLLSKKRFSVRMKEAMRRGEEKEGKRKCREVGTKWCTQPLIPS